MKVRTCKGRKGWNGRTNAYRHRFNGLCFVIVVDLMDSLQPPKTTLTDEDEKFEVRHGTHLSFHGIPYQPPRNIDDVIEEEALTLDEVQVV